MKILGDPSPRRRINVEDYFNLPLAQPKAATQMRRLRMHQRGLPLRAVRLKRCVRSAVLSALCVTAAAIGAVNVPPQQAEAAATYYGVFTFDKNPQNPSNSRLYWDVYRSDLDSPRRISTVSWRAGSGVVADSCAKGRGWLPNGTYSVKLHQNYGGSVIRGRAFELGNHRCANGTMRTELFIHTESGNNNRQCANAAGDQACRWEFPAINDYRSAGCIKLSPGDLRAASEAFRRFYAPERNYSARLRVIS